MDERIEWEEVVEHREKVWLMVDRMHHRRIATREDLLRACDAAGLVVVEEDGNEATTADIIAACEAAGVRVCKCDADAGCCEMLTGVVGERDDARADAAAAIARAEKAEAERDAARNTANYYANQREQSALREHIAELSKAADTWRTEHDKQLSRARTAEAERDKALAELKRAKDEADLLHTSAQVAEKERDEWKRKAQPRALRIAELERELGNAHERLSANPYQAWNEMRDERDDALKQAAEWRVRAIKAEAFRGAVVEAMKP